MCPVEYENENMEIEEEGCCASEIDWVAIMTTALIGGIVSGFACFFYKHVLSEKQRNEIKEAIVSKARPAVAKLIACNPQRPQEEDDLY